MRKNSKWTDACIYSYQPIYVLVWWISGTLYMKRVLVSKKYSGMFTLIIPNMIDDTKPEGYICICLRGKCAKIIEAVPGKSREPAEKTNQLSYRSNIMQIAVACR